MTGVIGASIKARVFAWLSLIRVLLANGTILGAGDGRNYKLGANYSTAINSIFVPIPTPEPMIKIAGSDSYGGTRAAISQTGKVYFWGRGNNGQCGLSSTGDVSILTTPTGAFQGNVQDVQIAGANDQEAAYILAGGILYAAGYNAACNLCDGAGTTNATVFAPVNGIPSDATIVEFVVAGQDTSYGPLVRSLDGRVFSGGSGNNYELGWEMGTVAASPVIQDVFIRGQRGGKGDPGAQGVKGDPGGFLFLCLSVYPSADPGTGFLSVSTLTLGQTGTLAISKTTVDAVALGLFELQWAQSSSSIKGQLAIRDTANPNNFVVLNIVGAVTDNSTWCRIPIQVVAAGGTLLNNGRLSLTFTRTGDGPQASYANTAIATYARMFA